MLRLLDSLLVAYAVYPLVRIYIGEWQGHYETLMVLSFGLSLVVFNLQGLYHPWRGQDYLSEVKAILAAWIKLVFLILFVLFVFKVAQRFSRVVLVAWFFSVPVVLCTLHGMARGALRFIRARGRNQRHAVIVGAGELGLSLAKYIGEIAWAGIQIKGFFDDNVTTSDLRRDAPEQKPVLGTIADLPEYLEKNDVDFMYIALSMRHQKKIHNILINCRTLEVHVYFVPDLYAFRLFNSKLHSLGDILLLDFNPESNRKRLFDIVFSLMVVLFTLPLTLLIALLIKLQDFGPVFYGHRRVTTMGRRFSCLKFRTMHVDAEKKLADILANDPAAKAEWDKTFKLKKDPRVTWIGKILRKTSLDELPQFLNVLRGDMSVVGARPIVHKELCDYYGENGGIYCSIKPGVTGLWQVSKRSDIDAYQDRVDLDTWYILNHNFWLDLKIIFKTIGCMVSRKGAY